MTPDHRIAEPLHFPRRSPSELLRQSQDASRRLSASDGLGQGEGVGIEPHIVDSVVSLNGHWAMCSCGAPSWPTAELDDARAWVCDRAITEAHVARLRADCERGIERRQLALQRALSEASAQAWARR